MSIFTTKGLILCNGYCRFAITMYQHYGVGFIPSRILAKKFLSHSASLQANFKPVNSNWPMKTSILEISEKGFANATTTKYTKEAIGKEA